MILILSLIVLGIVGHMVGKQKGRASDGFWLCLLLGPIGLICILLLPNAGALCPECKGVLGKGARRCMHCGQPLYHAHAAKPNVPTPALPPDTLPCPYCGADLDASEMVVGRNRCGACRREFNAG